MLRTLGCTLAILSLSISWTFSYSGDRPNVVLIYADDVGFGDVSCNGQLTLKTPSIDRIASEGLRLTDAHCSAATCTPSRFAMLTGMYAFRQKGTGVAPGNARLIIDPDRTTLADVFKLAKYTTGVVGKWHLGLGGDTLDWNGQISPGPADLGFDYHFLIPATGDRVPCVYVEQGRVADSDPADPISVSYTERIDHSPSGEEAKDQLKQKWSHGHHFSIVNGISRIGWMTGGKKARWVDEDMADVLTSKACKFIDDHASRPFFLYFATHDIHVPRVPHSRFAGKSGLGPRGDAMLQLDYCVGRILEKLDQLGLTENTIVMFSSDNGPVLDDGYVDDANEKLGTHDPNGVLRGGKYSMFEGGTRVPFVIRWPKRIPAGQTSPALFGQIDLPATFRKLLDVHLDEDAFPDSRDALPTLLGEDRVGRPHLMHEAGALALRMGKWKFLPRGSTRDEMGPWKNVSIGEGGALFDLSSEAGENQNVADQFPDVLRTAKSLHGRLKTEFDTRIRTDE